MKTLLWPGQRVRAELALDGARPISEVCAVDSDIATHDDLRACWILLWLTARASPYK
jgi:hypothetical protein